MWTGNSLAAQRIGFQALISAARVQSLAGNWDSTSRTAEKKQNVVNWLKDFAQLKTELLSCGKVRGNIENKAQRIKRMENTEKNVKDWGIKAEFKKWVLSTSIDRLGILFTDVVNYILTFTEV